MRLKSQKVEVEVVQIGWLEKRRLECARERGGGQCGCGGRLERAAKLTFEVPSQGSPNSSLETMTLQLVSLLHLKVSDGLDRSAELVSLLCC